MDVTKMLDTKVINELTTNYRTSSGGLALLCRSRKWLATANKGIQYKGTRAKVPVQPIIATAPLELLQVDFTSIEMTMELDQPPSMVSVLVFCNHFMKHIMAYVTPKQTAKTGC